MSPYAHPEFREIYVPAHISEVYSSDQVNTYRRFNDVWTCTEVVSKSKQLSFKEYAKMYCYQNQYGYMYIDTKHPEFDQVMVPAHVDCIELSNGNTGTRTKDGWALTEVQHDTPPMTREEYCRRYCRMENEIGRYVYHGRGFYRFLSCMNPRK